MEYLKILKKDKLGMFIFSLCSTIAIILYFRRSFMECTGDGSLCPMIPTTKS